MIPGHQVFDEVRSRLIQMGEIPTPASVSAAVRSSGHVVDSKSLVGAVAQLHQDLVGFGLLQPWVGAPGVTDVLVNGPEEVWVDRGCGLERVEARFRDETSLRRLVQRLATAAGRRIDDAHPFVDAQLPGGIRMHAMLPPISSKLCLSLRIARRHTFTLDELVSNRTVHEALASQLQAIIRSRRSFLITGGTGSGKTTVLSCLLGLVEANARIVIVEDTRELRPAHPHVISLESRPANVEQMGEVDLTELVRQALRMRPDRLVVGEARGAEIVDLLAAMNTGHEGGCATLHANRPVDVPARVEALCSRAGVNRSSAHSQLAAGVDSVLHIARRADGSRYVSELAELDQQRDGLVVCRPTLQVDASGELSSGVRP